MKVRITADAVLAIVKSIFADEDVNAVVDDPAAPPDWAGKTVEEILNVEYYTFKHRPKSSQEIINKAMETGEADTLTAVKRSFCVLSLGNIERIFSKDVDMAVCSASLEYYIQTNKIKLLEYLIEDCNIALSGLRIPVQFGAETRQAVVIFGRPNIADIQTGSKFGEIAIADIAVNIILYPDVASYSDYEVSFSFIDKDGAAQTATVPVSSFAAVNAMTQKAVPLISNPAGVGNINLSRANTFTLVMDGYNNAFTNYITDKALSADGGTGNNQVYTMTVKRGGAEYTHSVVIKDHQITVNADTGNEVHTLSLVTTGI